MQHKERFYGGLTGFRETSWEEISITDSLAAKRVEGVVTMGTERSDNRLDILYREQGLDRA